MEFLRVLNQLLASILTDGGRTSPQRTMLGKMFGGTLPEGRQAGPPCVLRKGGTRGPSINGASTEGWPIIRWPAKAVAEGSMGLSSTLSDLTGREVQKYTGPNGRCQTSPAMAAGKWYWWLSLTCSPASYVYLSASKS